jgi:hypothetical protein
MMADAPTAVKLAGPQRRPAGQHHPQRLRHHRRQRACAPAGMGSHGGHARGGAVRGAVVCGGGPVSSSRSTCAGPGSADSTAIAIATGRAAGPAPVASSRSSRSLAGGFRIRIVPAAMVAEVGGYLVLCHLTYPLLPLPRGPGRTRTPRLRQVAQINVEHETSSDDNRTQGVPFLNIRRSRYSSTGTRLSGYGTIDETSCRCFFYDTITYSCILIRRPMRSTPERGACDECDARGGAAGVR